MLIQEQFISEIVKLKNVPLLILQEKTNEFLSFVGHKRKLITEQLKTDEEEKDNESNGQDNLNSKNKYVITYNEHQRDETGLYIEVPVSKYYDILNFDIQKIVMNNGNSHYVIV